MLRAGLALALLCVAASPSVAQGPKSIDPGMTQAKVVERLGEPDASRVSGDFKYLFYRNGCIRQCGMDDVVILEKDSVVDAMFRSPERAYTGKSSSPRAIPADVASRTRPRARDIPSAEVVQAGAVKSEPAEKPAAKSDSTAKVPAAAKHAASADTTHRDTINATLRIKVKPQHHSTAATDSARTDSTAKRPPHDE
jgi:hypothetical protein